MAFIHSKNTYISINAVDLSAYVTQSSELNKTTDTHEVTAYGNDFKAYAPGLIDGTFSCEGTYDSTASTGTRAALNAVHAGNVAVEIIRRPEGTGSSLPEDTFDAVMTSLVETSAVGDMIMWSAEFQISGDVDTTAQSA